jgi:hypothetical protein
MNVKINMRSAEQAFAGFINVASQMTGLPKEKIILAEAGSVLKACAGDTKVAPIAQIDRGATLRALRGSGLTGGGNGGVSSKSAVTINAGIKGPFGRVFIGKKQGGGFRRTHDANFVPLNLHYSNDTWQALQGIIDEAKAKISVAITKARGSAALARKSWIQIADTLGIRLERVPGGNLSASAIAQARHASAGGKEANNGASTVQKTNTRYAVTLINQLPYGQKIGFQQLLAVKIAGRVRYFRTALEKGFKGSLEETTKRFRGWTVK